MTKNDIENQLIKRAIAGDVDAFAKLVKEHESSLFAHACFLSKNEKDAEDILQEAFLKAFIYIKNFKGDSSFKTWLWKIIRNEFYNFKTSKKTPGHDLYLEDFAELDNPNQKTAPENQFFIEEQKNLLKSLINKLSQKYKEVIILVDLQEKTYEEVAEILEISIPALKSRLFRAREKLTEITLKNKKLF